LFGESVEVTEALCKKHFDKFDWDFASKLLSPGGRAEYNRVSGLAWAEYDRVHGLAWAEYNRVHGPAWAEYDRVNGLAWAEYERVHGPAWAAIYVAEGGK
jgi:phage tail protein X